MYITERIARLIETKVILACVANSIPRIALGININKATQCSLVKVMRKLSNLSVARAVKEYKQIQQNIEKYFLTISITN